MTIASALIELLGDYADGTAPSATTPRSAAIVAALPELYRKADDGTLAAYVIAATQTLGAVELLVDAIDYVPADEGGPATDLELPAGRSILTDTDRTPWPAWLAQAVGVRLDDAGIAATDLETARAAIADAVNGYLAGTTGALAAAGRRTLTGARTIRVRCGTNPDPWVVTVSTAAAETPDPAALEAAIRRVLPAGHDLDLDNAVGNWLGIETLAPTWADVDALTWADLEELYA